MSSQKKKRKIDEKLIEGQKSMTDFFRRKLFTDDDRNDGTTNQTCDHNGSSEDNSPGTSKRNDGAGTSNVDQKLDGGDDVTTKMQTDTGDDSESDSSDDDGDVNSDANDYHGDYFGARDTKDDADADVSGTDNKESDAEDSDSCSSDKEDSEHSGHESGVEKSDDESSEDENEGMKKGDTMPRKFSIYKIDHTKLNEKRDMKKMVDELIQLTGEREDSWVDDNNEVTAPYAVKWLRFKAEQDENYSSKKIAKELGPPDTPRKPHEGQRLTGNILIYYRIDDNGTPEIFFLCKGYYSRVFLRLADPHFPLKVAQKYMDDKKIKVIETINIAGPEMTTTRKFRTPSGTFTLGSMSSISDVVAKAVAAMKEDNNVHAYLKSEGTESGRSKTINFEIGLNYFRILKDTTWKQNVQILQMISQGVKDLGGDTFYNLSFVYRILPKDKETVKSLKESLNQQAIKCICSNCISGDFYLSHRFLHDWITASTVMLYFPRKGRKSTVVWESTPSLNDVVDVLHRSLTKSKIKRYLENGRIRLSFEPCDEKPVSLLEYIHGQTTHEDKTAFKVGQKWYMFMAEYSETVDKAFVDFVQMSTIRQKDKEYLPFPWRRPKDKKTNILFPKSAMAKDLEIKEEDVDILLKALTKCTQFVDDKKRCQLTENSCKLLEKSEIAKVLKGKGGKGKDQGTSNEENDDVDNATDEAEKKKRIAIEKTLLESSRNGSAVNCPTGVLKALQRERSICEKTSHGSYVVLNGNLTTDTVDDLGFADVCSRNGLEQTDILKFLRLRCNLSEAEYNETYLLEEESKERIYLPGDRVLAQKVELFDVMMHDKERNITYLYHVKEKFGQNTRDACAQIRESANLLWLDRLKGKTTHCEELFDSLVRGDQSDPYKTILKEKLLCMGKEAFLEMFSVNVRIVYVYSFMNTNSPDGDKLSTIEHFRRITKDDFTPPSIRQKIYKNLVDLKILNQNGYLADQSIGLTSKPKFCEKMKKDNYFKLFADKSLESIYDTLVKHGRCSLSTIAKVELLTLAQQFTQFQIGGGKAFELRVCQIKGR